MEEEQYAQPNTVYLCLYAYYKLGYSKQHLAHIFSKSVRTLSNWIKTYKDTGVFQRAKTVSKQALSADQRKWLVHFYEKHPLAYLDEAQEAFTRVHRLAISKTSVWRIIHESRLTWKILERRAMHIKEQDIFRFTEELSQLDWSHQNLVILDERNSRFSVLASIGVNEVIDYFNTDGTFDRVEFTECCQTFVHSLNGHVRQYPGPNSVWILDGAAIHRHPEIVHYLRSVGVVVIFLPAYCPFFNPIEFLFGYVKRSFQRHYVESSNRDFNRDLLPFVVRTLRRFEAFNTGKVFEHCGWRVQGFFDPTRSLSVGECGHDTLDFTAISA
ncbi:hypothetical protein PHMEG_00028077 [Phytophthora megakarya]|uniref:Tc1-like transposase DDE domain-containing protein n=1 Tax=Phytophthora megakarya TaxID=4795 RepID=A0A225V5R1_9STRA|nr:hypothetical protein PHMEG_00028077 [Phytophthora megakarya]